MNLYRHDLFVWNPFTSINKFYHCRSAGVRQKTDILINTCNLWVTEPGNIHSVISHYFQIFRHSFSGLHCKMHITERRLVCSKHPVYSVALAYGFPCGSPVCLMIKLVPFHHQIYDFHSVFGKNRLKNGMSVIGGNIRRHSGNMKDFPALVFKDNLSAAARPP